MSNTPSRPTGSFRQGQNGRIRQIPGGARSEHRKGPNQVDKRTSAGAILTAQTAVQLRKLGLPLPAALGFISGFGDFARSGDSRYIYSVRGFLDFKPPSGPSISAYVGRHNPADPLLSPIYADLKGFPPTLCMTGTRDMLLSGTSDFHRALLRAGVDARLIVFDGLPHAHWYSFHLPESKEALQYQAAFFNQPSA